MKIVILLITLGLISFLLTYLIIKITKRYNLFNVPNERSLHLKPIPRLGGVAINLTWYAGITFLFIWKLIDSNLYYALLCGLMISIISFIDDLFGLPVLIRIIIHFFTSVLALFFLNGLRHFVLPGIEINYPLLIYPFVIVGMVWFINLFNFMDGIDGFASNEAITISLVLFYFSGNFITLLLNVCILGFFVWNFPKAKIFLGDTGSTQIGFILIVLGIYFHNNFDLSILNWIMIAAPFWLDATVTMVRRWYNGEKLSQSHKKHAYQRLVISGFSHPKVNLILIVINIFIFLIILLYREYNFIKIPLTLMTIAILFLLYKKVDKLVSF